MLLHERVRVPTALMSRAAGTRVLCLLYAQQSVYSMDATLWSSRHKQLRKWASFQLLLWTIIKSKYFSFLITPIMQLWMFYWEKSLVVAFTLCFYFIYLWGWGGFLLRHKGKSHHLQFRACVCERRPIKGKLAYATVTQGKQWLETVTQPNWCNHVRWTCDLWRWGRLQPLSVSCHLHSNFSASRRW